MHDNWSDRIKAIEAEGMTLCAIASEVGLSTGALSDIKRGATKQPRANAALALITLHERVSRAAKRKRDTAAVEESGTVSAGPTKRAA